MIMLSCYVEPPSLEYIKFVRRLISRVIDRVDNTSRKKKKDQAYPGMEKLKIISTMNMIMKAILSPSIMLSEDLSIKITRMSSMNSEHTVSRVMKIWKMMLCLRMNTFILFSGKDSFFEHLSNSLKTYFWRSLTSLHDPPYPQNVKRRNLALGICQHSLE